MFICLSIYIYLTELEVVALDHKMEVVDNEDDAYPLVSCELEEMAYPWEVEAVR